MSGINGVTKQTFSQMDIDCKLDVLFDCLLYLSEQIKQKKNYEYGIAGITGFLGGMMAILGKYFWNK